MVHPDSPVETFRREMEGEEGRRSCRRNGWDLKTEAPEEQNRDEIAALGDRRGTIPKGFLSSKDGRGQEKAVGDKGRKLAEDEGGGGMSMWRSIGRDEGMAFGGLMLAFGAIFCMSCCLGRKKTRHGKGVRVHAYSDLDLTQSDDEGGPTNNGSNIKTHHNNKDTTEMGINLMETVNIH